MISTTELTFTSHDGYVFHDPRGFEAGGEDELKIVQDFVLRKSWEKKLKERLHVTWFVSLCVCSCKSTRVLFRYCIPIDSHQPSVDSQYFECLPG